MEEYPLRCSVEVDGKQYKGAYAVEDGLLFVRFRGRRKGTQLGALPCDILARMLLRELVVEKELAESSASAMRELKRRQTQQCQAYLDLLAAVERAAALRLAGKASATDPEFLRLTESADDKLRKATKT